jgi:hypothetical protein
MSAARVLRSLPGPLAAVISIALVLACGDHFLTEPDGAERAGSAAASAPAADLTLTVLAGDGGCTDEDCPPAPDPGCTDEDCPPPTDPGCTDEDCPPDPGCTDEDCPPDPGCTDEDCPPPPDPGCTDEDCPPVVQLVVDIKPGSYPNSWGCKAVGGALPVAVLSTEDFDATEMNANTVRFGKDGTEAAPAHVDQDGNVRRHVEDVDGDGLGDMVFHFRFGDTGFSCDDIPSGSRDAILMGWLAGMTDAGDAVKGGDELRLVGAR